MKILDFRSDEIRTLDFIDENNVVFVMPYIDADEANRAAIILSERSNYKDATLILVNDVDRQGFIKTTNEIFQKSRSVLFGYLASDVFPSRNWLKKSTQAFEKCGHGLLAFNDGKWEGRLASFGLASREWIGNIYPDNLFFHHEYNSHYADTELSSIALACNQMIYDPNIVVMEVDFKKDKKSVNLHDRDLWTRRRHLLRESKIAWATPAALDMFA